MAGPRQPARWTSTPSRPASTRWPASCPAATLDALVTHLFVELGFAGDQHDYYDPRNSYLDEVLTRRRGIPITLSVLAMTVGRRLGVELAGVGMPGHFLLRDEAAPDVFVDAYHGGATLDRAGCADLFHRVHGPGTTFHDAFLEPVGTLDIVARMLANLRNVVRVARRPGGVDLGAAPAHPPARLGGGGPGRPGHGPGLGGPLRRRRLRVRARRANAWAARWARSTAATPAACGPGSTERRR